MASSLKNLSDFNIQSVPDASTYKIGIVVSEWNEEVTGALKDGAIKTLLKYNVKEENILVKYVPGSFELTHGAKVLIEKTDVDAVICLGCVIKGGTPHFDYVCQGVTQGIASLNANYNTPVIFGILTTDNQQQALDRAGGIHGNKGDEGAYTALKMVGFTKSLDTI